MRTFPSLLALALVLAACTSPLAPTSSAVSPPPTGTGAVRLVLHPLIPASRAVLAPDPTFVAVRVIDSATGRVQFGTGHNDGAGIYAVTNLGALVPGRWTIRAFLYDNDTSLTLLYSGGQEITVTAGDNPVTLPVAAPGSLAGISVALANMPTGITVLWQDTNQVPTTVPARFRAGQTAKLVTTVDGEVALSLALDQRVLWTSSNPALATVSASGLATFKASGTVTLTAKAAADETVVANQTIQVVPALFGHWKPVYVANDTPRVIQTVPHPLVIEGQGTTDANFSLVATFADSRVRGPVVGTGASASWRPTEAYDYASGQWKPLTSPQPTYGGLMTLPNPVVTLEGAFQYLLEPWDNYEPVTSITLAPPGVLTDLGTPVGLVIAGIIPAAPSVGVFAYTSTNPNAVSVSPSGLMTLHTGAGSATLRVTAVADPTVFAEVLVSHGQLTVLPPAVDTVTVDTTGLPWNGVFGLTSGPSSFTYHATSSGTPTSWAWVLDGAVVHTSGAAPSSDYTLDVKSPALALGPHSLSVEATTADELVVTNDQTGGTLNFTVVNTVTVPLAAVSAGGAHTMLLKADGTLWGTGANEPGDGSDGALGDGTYTSRTTFVPVLTGVASVAAGEGFTMAVKFDGSLWATGYNHFGELGDGTTTRRNTFEQVMTGVASVSAGGGYTMVVKTDGSLWAAGNNGFGQLGDGTTTGRTTFERVLTSGVAMVAAGDVTTYVVKTDGSLWAAGNNSYGQYGDGTYSDSLTFRQVVASGVTAVACVSTTTVILKTDGSVWTAGYGNNGGLGDGTMFDRNTFVQVMTGAVSVAANSSNQQVMVVKAGGLWATGVSNNGALGDGTNLNRYTFEPVMTEVASVATGNGWTMVIRTDGSLWATGDNAGTFGDSTTVATNRFKRVM